MPEMSDYEREAWANLIGRRDRFLSRRVRRVVPEVVRRRATQTGRAAVAKAQELPARRRCRPL
jgi:hypothetical protein